MDNETRSTANYLAPVAVGLALRFFLMLFLHFLYGPFSFPDESGYDIVGWKLASAWKAGEFPPPHSVGYAGTLSHLMFVYVGAVYFVFGRSFLIVKILNVFLSALGIFAAGSLGRRLGSEKLGQASAWTFALYPSAIFWGASGLKDAPLASLFLSVLALSLLPLNLGRFLAFVPLVAIAFLTRPVLAVACVFGLSAAFLVTLVRRKENWQKLTTRRTSRVLLIALAPVLLITVWKLGSPYLDVIATRVANEGFASTRTTIVGSDSLWTFRAYPEIFEATRALLGPFPWSYGPGSESIYRWLYPGVITWILLLPGAAVGIFFVLRRGSMQARAILVATLIYLYVYLSVSPFSSEGFFRQRFQIEPFILILSVFGLHKHREGWRLMTTLGVLAISAAVMIQTELLPPWFVVIGLVSLGLVAWWKHLPRTSTRQSQALIREINS